MENYIKQALELTKAQASVSAMTEEEIITFFSETAESMKKLFNPELVEEENVPAVDPKKAIREKSIICLECGQSFKIITKKHLASHGLTPKEYKEKWGYKKNKSLSAKYISRERRKRMKEMKLWEK